MKRNLKEYLCVNHSILNIKITNCVIHSKSIPELQIALGHYIQLLDQVVEAQIENFHINLTQF